MESPNSRTGRHDVLINPTLIVEVQPPSTERFDRGFKFDAYTEIGSLREYVLVASDRPSLEVFSRQADGRWLLTKAIGLESLIELASIDCRLALAPVYRDVDFAGAGAAAGS